MNKKTLACALVFLLMAGMIEGTQWMNKRMQQRHDDAVQAGQAADSSELILKTQQFQFEEMKHNSKDLITYLKTWEPFFKEVDSSEDAELKISLRIKENDLVSLSQRYEIVNTKGNPSIPQMMRAHLSFEDNYARLVNWFGLLEEKVPTMRIGSLHMAKGTRPEDVKIDAVIDVPLLQAEAEAK